MRAGASGLASADPRRALVTAYLDHLSVERRLAASPRLAALDGVLYRTTIDAHVMAISMADGKTIWKKQASQPTPSLKYSSTDSPRWDTARTSASLTSRSAPK